MKNLKIIFLILKERWNLNIGEGNKFADKVFLLIPLYYFVAGVLKIFVFNSVFFDITTTFTFSVLCLSFLVMLSTSTLLDGISRNIVEYENKLKSTLGPDLDYKDVINRIFSIHRFFKISSVIFLVIFFISFIAQIFQIPLVH